MSKVKKPPQCKVCGKKTEYECSHIDCPNRKRLTAGANMGDISEADGGRALNPSAWFKVPTNKD